MTTPSQQEFYQLLMTVQDGTASQQQLDRWEQLIIDSPQARHWYFQFQCQAVALTDYHRQRVFLNETTDESSESKDAPLHFPMQDDAGTGDQPPADPQSRHFPASRWFLWIGGVAAMILASFYLLTNHPWEKPLPGGSLSYVEQAVWNGFGPKRNQLQKNHIYRLKSGSIRANLVGGGIASLAAPAEFRIVDDSTIELTQGKLIGRLPNPDSSLRIYCQNLQIVDSTKSFGVTAEPRTPVNVSVFDGQLTVRPQPNNTDWTNQVLRAGQSIASSAEGPKSVAFAPTAYADLWPLAMGIDEAASIVQFVPPGQEQFLTVKFSNDQLFLLPEKLNLALDTPLRLHGIRSGRHWPDQPAQPLRLPAGKRISSYLLVYNSPDSQYQKPYSLSGSIRFERPILAVIVARRQLQHTDSLLGLDDLDYSVFSDRHLEGLPSEEGQLPGDVVSVSEDGRQLYFNLNVGAGTDHLRVLVEGTSPNTAP